MQQKAYVLLFFGLIGLIFDATTVGQDTAKSASAVSVTLPGSSVVVMPEPASGTDSPGQFGSNDAVGPGPQASSARQHVARARPTVLDRLRSIRRSVNDGRSVEKWHLSAPAAGDGEAAAGPGRLAPVVVESAKHWPAFLTSRR